LLGKRVDYSGRSVIVVGPELRLHECGLPKDMALELFKPFVIRRLIERGYARTAKRAKLLVERKEEVVWDVLDSVIDGHPVLLNRAPTLHRLGIQAFQPRLVEGKAIQLHPLVCTAFNADFDGDQMAVHVPLSHEAQMEALLLMLAPHSIMHTQNGEPIAVPSQDMVLGLYYLTKVRHGALGEGKFFASPEEAILAYDSGHVELHAKVKVRVNGQLIETTVGRIIFNQIVPPELGFVNELLTKKRLRQLIGQAFRVVGLARTVEFLDALKDMGFRFATEGGLTVSIDDVIIPPEKEVIIRTTQEEVDKINEAYMMGILSPNERYNKVIDAWTSATNRVADHLYRELARHQDGFNTFWMMLDSQARGSKEQIRQLGGLRGLMAKPQKTALGAAAELAENPIISNLREGLSVLEYFISTHGARKGLADTALKTADAGYLTRRLHDVAQDVIVTMHDCGTIRGIEVSSIKEGEELEISLYERILGRVALGDIVHPLTGEAIVRGGDIIDEEAAQAIADSPIESVPIRSVLTCEAPRGVCAKCYGRNPATGQLVEVGEAVGTIASQSIGEPGTQLTLRTFHTGGAALLATAQSVITAKFGGIVRFHGLRSVPQPGEDGENVHVVLARGAGLVIVEPEGNRELVRYDLPVGARLYVREGQFVQRGEQLYEWDPYNLLILAHVSGQVRYRDLKVGITFLEQVDEQTGHLTKVVIPPRERGLTPQIEILDEAGKVLHAEIIPARAYLLVEDGERVEAGEILAKIPREIRQLQDITGGLPRVIELFEARRPQNPAVVAEIDGIVSLRLGEGRDQGKRVIKVTSHDRLTEKEYRVSATRHVLVQDGDSVRAGERLTEGPIDPHDILRIQGVQAVQEYLLREIQQVYRMQGVNIADKHVEIIIRQMLRRVKIISPGDSMFLEGDIVDRLVFQQENERLKNSVVIVDAGDSKFHVGEVVPRRKFRESVVELQKKEKRPPRARDAEPATAEPILLGITEAALSTDSWLSAASFQETINILTEAALAAQVDELRGLKENIIFGQLIPAGTGQRRYQDILVTTTAEPVLAEVETRAVGQHQDGDQRRLVPPAAAEPLGRRAL
ncbi:MAG: DNA-directed RNA polymerase subunit beta', partial [Chlorobiota bacterium]